MTDAISPLSLELEDAVATAVAKRVAARRKDMGLSFDALAARSGVSKGTLVQVEGGRANPSISTLCRLASALEVSVVDLIAPLDAPERAVIVVGRDGARQLWSGPLGGSAVLLAGTPGPDMLEIWNWTLMPGERFEASVHAEGTRELIHVIDGSLLLDVAGGQNLVAAGNSAIALTDRAHAYGNPGTVPVQFTMVVHEPQARS